MEVKMVVFIQLALQASLIMETVCYKMNLYRKMHVEYDVEFFTVYCEAAVPLVACDVWSIQYPAIGRMEMNDHYLNQGMGVCSLTKRASYLRNAMLEYEIIVCRSRSIGGGWQYAHRVTRPMDWSFPFNLKAAPTPKNAEPGIATTKNIELIATNSSSVITRPGNIGTEHATDNIATDPPSVNTESGNFSRETIEPFESVLPPPTEEPEYDGEDDTATTVDETETYYSARRFKTFHAAVPPRTGPLFVYVDAGKDVTITYRLSVGFDKCYFKTPSSRFLTKAPRGDKSFRIDSTDTECSITFNKVHEYSGGFVMMKARTARENYFWATAMVVKSPPKWPVLTLNHPDGRYNLSDTLVAWCSVGLAAPVAKITWYIGDAVVRNDEINDEWNNGTASANTTANLTEVTTRKNKVIGGRAAFNVFKAALPYAFDPDCIRQKLTLKLTRADDRRDLICKAEHTLLPGGEASAKQTIYLADEERDISDYLLYLTFFLIGLAAATLFVALVVALILCCTYATKIWCFDPSCA